jgi:transcriptional antiterminator RfaH
MSSRKLRRKYRPSSMPVQGKGRIVRRDLSHRREIDHAKQWFCIRTNIGAERRAAFGLREAGFDVFRPVDDRWRVFKHRCSDVSVNWFARYMFLGSDDNPRFDIVRATDGVESILVAAGRPVAVRPEVLQKIADELAGYRKTAPAPFKQGQGVTIDRGPYTGIPALIKSLDEEAERAIVELEMFKQKHELELDFVELKAA